MSPTIHCPHCHAQFTKDPQGMLRCQHFPSCPLLAPRVPPALLLPWPLLKAAAQGRQEGGAA